MWRLDQSKQAFLELDRLRASVDLRQASPALAQLELPGERPEARLLELQLGAAPLVASTDSAYVRHADLIACLSVPQQPLRVQVYWRYQQLGPATAVQLIVSVETDSLGSDPSLAVRSRLAAGECWRLRDDAGNWESVAGNSAAAERWTPSDAGRPAMVARPAGSSYSYLEVVHPTDFVQTTLRREGPTVVIEHRLFPEQLEKGVIRRGRITAAWLQRADDLAAAAACYRQLAREAPPLTT